MGNLRDNHPELFYKINKTKKERNNMTTEYLGNEQTKYVFDSGTEVKLFENELNELLTTNEEYLQLQSSLKSYKYNACRLEIEVEEEREIKGELEEEIVQLRAEITDLRAEITDLEQKDNKEVCHWTEEEDGDNDYESECGMYFSINAGTPIDNNMHFCPKCGNKLTVKEEKLK
jgi:predicted  nucleic acid-binding Zn-ribbon protein